MNQQNLKNLLVKYGLKPNFTFGQNFLVDDVILEDIVDAAELSKNDAVLEIGPGIGNLTKKLCERAGFVLSVEKDPKFFPILKSIKKDNGNFRFEIADILKFDFQDFFQNNFGVGRRIHSAANTSLERGGRSKATSEGENPFDSAKGFSLRGDYKVVANIPYYITGKILQMLFAAKNKPESITILTQKEVAQNIVAGPGKLSVLAISVQIFGSPEIIRVVPANSFYPAPKVDSAILKIDLPKKPKFQIEDEKKFFRVVKACFAGKRKQIHNTLMNNLKLDEDQVADVLAALKINPAARPQEFTIEEWISLTEKLF